MSASGGFWEHVRLRQPGTWRGKRVALRLRSVVSFSASTLAYSPWSNLSQSITIPGQAAVPEVNVSSGFGGEDHGAFLQVHVRAAADSSYLTSPVLPIVRYDIQVSKSASDAQCILQSGVPLRPMLPGDMRHSKRYVNLQAGQTYYVRARTVTAVGPGIFSEFVAKRLAVAPSAPGDVRYTTEFSSTPGRSSMAVNLTWSEPSCPSCSGTGNTSTGDDQVRYHLSTIAASGGYASSPPALDDTAPVDVFTLQRWHILTNLTRSVRYWVRVRAENMAALGVSSWSAPVLVAAVEAPSEPRHLDIVAHGNASLLLSWLGPADTGAGDSLIPLERYELELWTANESISTRHVHVHMKEHEHEHPLSDFEASFTVNGSTTAHLKTQVPIGVPVFARIRAVNSAGISNWTYAKPDHAIALLLPSAPRAVSVSLSGDDEARAQPVGNSRFVFLDLRFAPPVETGLGRNPFAIGNKWHIVGETRPTQGEQLNNTRLEAALLMRSDFTHRDMDAFGISGLRSDHYILSGHYYFRPAVEEESIIKYTVGVNVSICPAGRRDRPEFYVQEIVHAAPVVPVRFYSEVGCEYHFDIRAHNRAGSGAAASVGPVFAVTSPSEPRDFMVHLPFAQAEAGSWGLQASWRLPLDPGDGLDVTRDVTSGLRWRRIGETRPSQGRELNSTALSQALHGRLHFSQSEWESFKIMDLHYDDYVLSVDPYYQTKITFLQPDDPRHAPEGFHDPYRLITHYCLEIASNESFAPSSMVYTANITHGFNHTLQAWMGVELKRTRQLDSFDANHDGWLSFQELQAGLTYNGFSSAQASEIFIALDSDGDSSITLDEYLKYAGGAGSLDSLPLTDKLFFRVAAATLMGRGLYSSTATLEPKVTELLNASARVCVADFAASTRWRVSNAANSSWRPFVKEVRLFADTACSSEIDRSLATVTDSGYATVDNSSGVLPDSTGALALDNNDSTGWRPHPNHPQAREIWMEFEFKSPITVKCASADNLGAGSSSGLSWNGGIILEVWSQNHSQFLDHAGPHSNSNFAKVDDSGLWSCLDSSKVALLTGQQDLMVHAHVTVSSLVTTGHEFHVVLQDWQVSQARLVNASVVEAGTGQMQARPAQAQVNVNGKGSFKITFTNDTSLLNFSSFDIWLEGVTARDWQGNSTILLRRSKIHTNASLSFSQILDQTIVPGPVIKAGQLVNCMLNLSELRAGAAANVSLRMAASLRNPIRPSGFLRIVAGRMRLQTPDEMQRTADEAHIKVQIATEEMAKKQAAALVDRFITAQEQADLDTSQASLNAALQAHALAADNAMQAERAALHASMTGSTLSPVNVVTYHAQGALSFPDPLGGVDLSPYNRISIREFEGLMLSQLGNVSAGSQALVQIEGLRNRAQAGESGRFSVELLVHNMSGVVDSCVIDSVDIWSSTQDEGQQPCNENYYRGLGFDVSNIMGAPTHRCLPCPPYSVSPHGSTSFLNCTCAVGYTGDPLTECVACPAGFYKAAPGSEACQECKPFQYVNQTAQGMCPPNDNLADCTPDTCTTQIVARIPLDPTSTGSVLPVGMAVNVHATTLEKLNGGDPTLYVAMPNARQVVGLDALTGACLSALRDPHVIDEKSSVHRQYTTGPLECRAVHNFTVLSPTGLARQRNGGLFFSDTNNYCVRAYRPAPYHQLSNAPALTEALSKTLPIGTPGFSFVDTAHAHSHADAPAQPDPPAGAHQGDSCQWSNDGVCDEPLDCDAGTDCTDCASCHRWRRSLDAPLGAALNSQESSLYILDQNRVISVAVDDESYPTSVFAGQVAAGYEDGVGSSAAFFSPKSIVLAHSRGDRGVLYVAEFRAHRIRQVDVSSRNVTSLAGYPWREGTADGQGSLARFRAPTALALTSDERQLFVADFWAKSIRVVDLDGSPSPSVRTLLRTPFKPVGLAMISKPEKSPTHFVRVEALFVAAHGTAFCPVWSISGDCCSVLNVANARPIRMHPQQDTDSNASAKL